MAYQRVPPARWDAALAESKRAAASLGNPVLSAVAFGNAVRNTGGASINLSTRKFLNNNESAYMVGGEEGVSPAKVAPISGSSEPALNDIISQMHRVKTSVEGSEDVYLGAWNDNKGNVVFDASRKYGNKSKAMGVARERREDAIYDVKKQKDIPVDYRGGK